MKKLITSVIAIFLIAIGLIIAVGVGSGSNDYVRITELDYKAEVVDEENSRGKVIITERLTFDVHAASSGNLFWELWRELPEEYIDGVKVDYHVLSVKEILADGSEIVYQESPQLYWWDEDYTDTSGELGPGKWFHSKGPFDDYYNFESLLFYVDGLYRETVVFEIQYEMFNASMRYNDSSELYLSLYYGDTIKYLTSLKGQILVPLEKMPQSGNYAAYTYGTTAHEFPFIESDSLNPGYHTFAFELNESQLKFKPYNQYVEFTLISFGEDKHLFTEHASYNHYTETDMLDKMNLAQKEYEELPVKALRNKTVTLIISSVITAFTLVITFLINQGFKKGYKFFKPSQHIDYFRDIPSDLDANFARKLVFCKHRADNDDGDGYSAAMLSLSHKGYIEVEQIDQSKDMTPSNVRISVKPSPLSAVEGDAVDPREALSPVEKHYLSLITRHAISKIMTLEDFQKQLSRDYAYTTSFLQNVKASINSIGINDGYFQKVDYKAPKNTMMGIAIAFVIIGVLVTLIGNLVSYPTRLDLAFGSFFIIGGGFIAGAAYLIRVSKDYLLLTQFGQDEYAKWRGLYNFLNNETLMVERGIQELAIWEKYLIYATAFGISDKVIRALKVVMPEEMLISSPMLHNHVFRSRTFYRGSRTSFSSATRSASFTSRSGGHGGYGGGGRGGGGGGGGH